MLEINVAAKQQYIKNEKDKVEYEQQLLDKLHNIIHQMNAQNTDITTIMKIFDLYSV